MKTKQPSLFLAMIFTLLAVSCGVDKPLPDTGTALEISSEPETEEVIPGLPEADFEGYAFTFLNGNTSYTYWSVVAEEQNGETINDAVFNRNCKVEERYNITLREISSKSPQSDYTKAVASGDNSFDIALLRMEWAFPVVLQNGAVNWKYIPNLNLDKPYWVQGSLKSMSLMNNIYFGVSLFDTSHFESVRAFYFNKRLVSEFNLESPYELVNSGKWTLDKFREMGLAVAADLNGDGVWDTDDRYGLIGYSNVLCNTLMAGVDSLLSIGKDRNDAPYFNLDSEYSIDRLLTVSKLMATGNGFVYSKNEQVVFRSGRSLFLNGLINEAAALREMEDDFGVLPAPKYNEDQKEYINLGGSPFFMTVPVTAENLDRTGAVMEALAYDSMGIIDSAFYDTVLKGKTSRDTESADMLDLIFSTLVYYHPLANSYLNAPLADNYLWNGRTDFASYFASVKGKIQAEIDEALATYAENVGG